MSGVFRRLPDIFSGLIGVMGASPIPRARPFSFAPPAIPPGRLPGANPSLAPKRICCQSARIFCLQPECLTRFSRFSILFRDPQNGVHSANPYKASYRWRSSMDEPRTGKYAPHTPKYVRIRIKAALLPAAVESGIQSIIEMPFRRESV